MGRWRGLIRAVAVAAMGVAPGVGMAPASASAAPLSWAPRVSISPHILNAVSCPTSSLCIAVGNSGLAASSLHPAGGTAAWTNTDIDGTNRLLDLSCASAHFCVAADNHARALTASNPTGGAADWHARTIDAGRWITGLSCPTAHLCVAVDRHGGIVTTTNPTGASHAWTRAQEPRTSFVAVSCPSSKLCVAATAAQKVFVSTNPAGGGRSWHGQTAVPSEQFLVDVSCASTHLCVLGNILNGTDAGFRPSTHPTHPGSWHPIDDVNGYPHEGNAHAVLSCTSSGFCAGFTRSDFSSGDVYVSAAGGRNWQNVPSANDSSVNDHLLSAISCSGPSLCVIVDQGGGAIVGSA